MSLLTKLFGPRESATARAAWVDATAHRVATQLAAQNAHALRAASRSLETATTKPHTESWATHSRHINDVLAMSLPTLWARSENLARDDEWATRYLIQLEDNVLGENGIQYQSRVRTPAGQFDAATNAELEAFWQQWAQRGACEVSGRYTFRECETLIINSLARGGEMLVRLRASGPYGFQLQLLPYKLLDVALRRDYKGNRVRMGVEIDDDGVPLFYWLLAHRYGESLDSDITTVGKHLRVPASQILHRFDAAEIDQLRGVPWLSTGAQRLWQLHDFTESAAVATSNAAKRQGFFVSPDGNAPPGFADTIVSATLDAARAAGKVLSADEITALSAAAQKYSTTVPGQFDTLPLGYSFQPFESKWPDVNSSGFIKDQIRGWSAARGVSYHTLGNDLSDVNYSSAQVGILDERNHFKVVRRKLTSWLHQAIGPRVLQRAVLHNTKLRASRLAEYIAAMEWQGHTWPAIDPRKAAEADDIALRNKSLSRRRIWIAKGLDPDDMETEILAEEKKFGPLDATATNASTTPAARDARDLADEPAPLRAVAGGRS